MTLPRLLPFLTLAALACSSPMSHRDPARNCNNPLPGNSVNLIVTARDARTLDHLTTGVSGSYATVGYADTLRFEHPGAATLIGEGPPGIYELTIRGAGYSTWDSTIVVEAAQCGGATPSEVIADLQPAP